MPENTTGITTKELFDRYFEQRSASSVAKIRAQVDREEVYAYERKIGKQLVEMDVDELFDMFSTFRKTIRGNVTNYSPAYASYDSMVAMYRQIFNYYIDNVKVIKNPFNDKRMKGVEAAKRLSLDKEPFNMATVEKIIGKVNNDCEPVRAHYVECIMRMFIDGFFNAKEIVLFKESMYDEQHMAALLPGRKIQLSRRTDELLKSLRKVETIDARRGFYKMASWHDSYFRFIVRPSEIDTLQSREVESLCGTINRTINDFVCRRYDVNINYRKLYLLGFYNFLVKKFGEERTYELLTSVRNSDDAKDLMGAAEMYGFDVDNVTYLKRALRIFIRV